MDKKEKDELEVFKRLVLQMKEALCPILLATTPGHIIPALTETLLSLIRVSFEEKSEQINMLKKLREAIDAACQ